MADPIVIPVQSEALVDEVRKPTGNWYRFLQRVRDILNATTADGQSLTARVVALEANAPVLIASGSLPAAGVAIVNIPQVFSHLLVQVDGASFDTNGVFMLVQPSSDNGASYDTTTANYVGLLVTTLVSIAALYVTSSIGLAADTFKAQAAIFGYRAGSFKNIVGAANINAGAGATTYNGLYTVTSAINAIRIVPSSNLFDAGTFALYGIP